MNRLVLVAPLVVALAAYEKIAALLAPAPAPTYAATPVLTPPQPAADHRSAASTLDVQQTSTVADVVNAANAFIATLSSTQQATLLQTFNSTNVTKWSNLPVNATNRIGLRMDALTAAQQTAAMAVVQAATGTTSNNGFDEVQKLRVADDYLAANGGGSAYGSGVYLIAFLGTPSTTGTWMLMFGGHHLATNITYSGGYVTGATPKFEGVEPLSCAAPNSNIFPTGTTIAPMTDEAAGMLAMLNGLTTNQKATAKLTSTFNDVVVGAGKDGQFPTTKVGLQCNQLTTAQQQLVMDAMAPWVKDVDDATAASLMAYYQTQLADTYVAYAGTGNLTSNGDYVRIDGPNVWIEFVCQNGVIFSAIHYHTIYRDRARDYGGNYYTTVTSARNATAAQTFSVYPNPASSGASLTVKLTTPATRAAYTLRTVTGQVVATKSFAGESVQVPTAGLAAGTYLLSLEADGQEPVTHRFVVK